MPRKIDRATYAAMFGPTTGDRVRLGDTALVLEVERDFAVYGDDLYEAWNIKGLPTLVLIDKQGNIAKTANKADAKTLAQFQLKIAELLRN